MRENMGDTFDRILAEIEKDSPKLAKQLKKLLNANKRHNPPSLDLLLGLVSAIAEFGTASREARRENCSLQAKLRDSETKLVELEQYLRELMASKDQTIRAQSVTVDALHETKTTVERERDSLLERLQITYDGGNQEKTTAPH